MNNKTTGLNLSDLRLMNVKRCEDVFHKLNSWSPTDWGCAMAGECGEACNQVKKLRRLDGADASIDTSQYRKEITDRIASEIADTIIYADLLAARLGIDLSKAIIETFNEVSDRRGSDIKLQDTEKE